ncbi:MAG: NAD(+) synthase [Ruminococcaceae bacterium]|nr:NAD(+) synthase [Oscillospiraceae bacterium]
MEPVMKIYFAKFTSAPMNITANFEKAMDALDRCIATGCDAIIYPAGCLLGAPLGVLKQADWMKCAYNKKIDEICKKAAAHGIAVVADKIHQNGENCIPEIRSSLCENSDAMELNGLKTRIVKNSRDLFLNVNSVCSGIDVVFINWMEKGVAGQKYLWTETLNAISAKYGTVFVLNTAGSGYTTHPDFYMPIVGMIKEGETKIYYGSGHAEYCPEYIEIEKPVLKDIPADDTDYFSMASFPVCYSQNPLIPSNVPEKFYCLDLFDMQCESLANRLRNINCKDIVLNLSGGLDSTMALLVCIKTFNMLGLDKKGMHILTQPGFGTSGTTKGLAHELCENLGLKLKTVDITDTCRAALLSIGHDGVTPDVTLENVQARTRTMNALNMANHLGAIMVGTGDLSEVALGFSTFGGDQLASYNVNCCVSKTVMRTMLPYITEMEIFDCVRETVDKVLNIPVSPELVPHGGEILQKTEDILAPYKLIDFYIYCTVVTKISPAEIVDKAYDVFGGEFTKEYITEKLKMFYRKFAVGQFKRSCSPECADLTHTSLVSENTSFASDGSTEIFLQNLS